MPLYEMILVCKLGETQALANLLKMLSLNIFDKGGIVRNFTNLGDRIPSKKYYAKDLKDYFVVRFMSVEFDASPETMLHAKNIARNHSETMDITIHKMKEKNYYKNLLNKVII